MMRLGDIMASAAGTDLSTLEVTGVTADSRKVLPGMVFAALPGSHADGGSFIGDAVARGAAAILTSLGTVWPPDVAHRPMITAAEPRQVLAQAAATLAGPQPAIQAAVTGTNGKTSTVDFLRQIWAACGHQAASLGTLGLHAPGFATGSGLTTPDPVDLAGTLAALAHAGIGRAAMEASSHGLAQFRLDGVRLTAAAISNVTRDHLDYHRTEGAYRAAKLRLFSEVLPPGAIAVANADMDPVTFSALYEIAKDRRLDFCTVGEAGKTIRLLCATPMPNGQSLSLSLNGRLHDVEIQLPGRFQADNVLLALGLAMALGEDHAIDVVSGLAGVRGRMELAVRLANGAAVYVDYAHTPDALERLLLALRPHARRLHVVFGAGGDRDHGKRAIMGAIAARLADRAIVTDDNPRTEDPAAIRAAILAACPDAIEIGDRAKAIAAGLGDLGPGDVLVIAGKGHEPGQTIGIVTMPFDDVDTVRRLA